jgi:hypothetical protein
LIHSARKTVPQPTNTEAPVWDLRSRKVSLR